MEIVSISFFFFFFILKSSFATISETFALILRDLSLCFPGCEGKGGCQKDEVEVSQYI